MNNHGFTIIELMIGVAVVGFFLIFVMFGVSGLKGGSNFSYGINGFTETF